MTFNEIVATRVALAFRRRQLVADWLFAFEWNKADLNSWAERIREANDASIAFHRVATSLASLEVR